jgi:hypothetical protein
MSVVVLRYGDVRHSGVLRPSLYLTPLKKAIIHFQNQPLRAWLMPGVISDQTPPGIASGPVVPGLGDT